MLRPIISLCLLFIFSLNSLGYLNLPGIAGLENKAYDLRVNLARLDQPDPRIVIIDIDEASLKSIGRWPWNRAIMAKLVDILYDYYYIQVLGFDILFAEPDRSSGLPVLLSLAQGPLRKDQQFQEFLEQYAPELDYDSLFARALQDKDVVLGFFFRNNAPAESENLNLGSLPMPLPTKNRIENLDSLLHPTGYGANLAIFQQAAQQGGFVDNPSISTDGIIRKVPVIQSYQHQLYGSFALAMVRALYGFPPVELVLDEMHTLVGLQVEELFIPTTSSGELFVPYRGKYPSYTYVSASDVLEKKVDPEILDGALVLMGTTATGLLDMRATPVGSVYPGVEIHANAISGILDQTLLSQPPGIQELDFFQHLFIGLILLFALPRLKLINSLILGVLLMAVTLGTNYYFWQELHVVLPLVSVLVFIALNFTLHFAYGYFVEDYNKRKLSHLFGQYVPPALVEEMSRNNAQVSLEGETRELTILFSDIRGFTSLSEQLEPQQLTRLMNQYLTVMTQIILDNRGTIDKYIGDAIMAFWGAPLADPEHASHAMQAAMDMRNAMPEINAQFRQQGFPEISIGIGLNTGMVNVGNMGSEFRMAYTVLGDDVNLASRLESITKQYKVDLIVSESTRRKAPEWLYQELDLVKVVGKNIPIAIYHPIARQKDINEIQQKEMYLFKLAIKLYRQQKWQDAKTILEDLLSVANNTFLYQLYLDRILAFQHDPPGQSWDGVFEAKSK